MKRLIFLSILVGLMWGACSRKSPMDAGFEKIDMLCDTDPRLSMSMLDSIDYGALSTADRHRYDLLSIKSLDKAYVRHTSDSLILDVVEYYDGHRKSGLYPEALYYGGRVYSDIGDLPTALEFFQKAIDAIPKDKEHGRLKRNVLVQTGRLLESLRLHSQAIPYMEKAAAISKELNDSIGVFYCTMDLMALYMNCDSIHKAGKYLWKAIRVASVMPPEDKAWIEVRRAEILLQQGKIDSAISVIRVMIDSTDTICRNYANKIATDIYRKAGILDSAYLRARELALSPNLNNRIYGFDALFSTELYPLIPKDSIALFVRAYNNHMEEYLNKYESLEALIQNSRYNYNLKQQEREHAIAEKLRAEKERNAVIASAAIIILVLVSGCFYIVYNNLWSEIKIRTAIQLTNYILYKSTHNLEYKKRDIEKASPQETHLIGYKIPSSKISRKNVRGIIREELLCNIRHLNGADFPPPAVDSILSQSDIVIELQQMVKINKGLPAKDPKWEEIDKAIHRVIPDFKSNLKILSLGRMDEREYRVAMLIKCGFKPAQISSLLLKGKSAATDRRRSLASKILGATDTAEIDRIILRI